MSIPLILSKKERDDDQMKIEMEPIGYVQTDATDIPRHWTVSDVEGKLVIDENIRRKG